MAIISTVHAERREIVGSSSARKLRAAGRVPAVMYGHGEGTVHLSLDSAQTLALLQAHAHMMDLELEGKTQSCLIQDADFDIHAERVLHVDLLRVSADEAVEVEVEVKLVGPAKGEKTGGSVELSLHTLEVRCVPASIPDRLELNIEDMEMGDVKHAKDVPLPAGVELVTDPEAGVVTIHHPAGEEIPAAAEGEASAEPELIRPERAGDEEAGD